MADFQNISLRRALADPNVLGHALQGESWALWKVMLLASRGEALNDQELFLYNKYTGRNEAPTAPCREAAFVIGRRGGKDRAVATLATYLATCVEYPSLARGEVGTMLIVAPDVTQANTQLSYIKGVFSGSPLLSSTTASETSESIVLKNQIQIVVRSANFRRLRGLTCIGAVASETAYFFSEGSSNPDGEILASIRPSLLTTGGPLLQISSPYSKKGSLWQVYKRHYGPKGDPSVLVVQGSSIEFNPTLPIRDIEEALATDRAKASADFLAEFRSDLESFVPREIVEACVDPGVTERPPHGHKYFGFADPSGGSGQDSMTLAIAHKDSDGRVVIDALRETRPPFSPEACVEEFSGLLRRYKITTIGSDRYAADWPREQFRKRGIRVEPSAKTTSDNFIELLPLLNTRTIVLLDSPRLVDQISKLERRTGSVGRDRVGHKDHASAHDDLAAAVAGVAFAASGGIGKGEVGVGYVDTDGRVHWFPRPGKPPSIFSSECNTCTGTQLETKQGS